MNKVDTKNDTAVFQILKQITSARLSYNEAVQLVRDMRATIGTFTFNKQSKRSVFREVENHE